MSISGEREARKYLRQALSEARRDDIPLVFVGSYARGTSTSAVSDIDVLVLDDEPTGRTPDAVHVVSLSRESSLTECIAVTASPSGRCAFGAPLTCREDGRSSLMIFSRLYRYYFERLYYLGPYIPLHQCDHGDPPAGIDPAAQVLLATPGPIDR